MITSIFTGQIFYKTSKAAVTLYWPVPGHTHRSQRLHDNNAIDISDANIGGATVIAAIGGTVTYKFTCGFQHYGSMGDCNGFGTGLVIVGTDGRTYQYAHMQAGSIPSNIVKGSIISSGQMIGKVGTTGNSSGNHLHFGICYGNYWSGTGNPDNESYIYNSANNSPAPVLDSPSIAVDRSNSNWHIDDYNIVPCAKIYNPNRSQITRVGIQIRDGENIIASKEEDMNSAYQYVQTTHAWFNCVSECGVKLRPGHTYTWQIYAYVGGAYVSTNWQTIKTTGTEKPSTPSFSTSKKDYAVGDAVTVNWGADANATQGYTLTLTQTKGGTYTKSLCTNSYNATSLAFPLPAAGEYKITGYAKGSQNSDTATLNKTIVAHNPSTVRFVEEDKDGKENLLCEQVIRYGYSAQAPINVSRKGHTFMGWKGEYSNVTSNRTIVAQFKRNTYKITFLDKDGNVLKTESVLYEDNATAPEPPEAEKGYVFAGWDSEDYKNVQGNASVKASYVWANNDLPVVITLNKCEFKDDGYIINYDIKNNPNTRTKGRALVSLKTSKDKLLDTTESNAFSLAKGEVKKGVEMYVPYEGKATKANLYIISGFSKGIPISEVETVDVERNWSDWSEEKPDENNEIESRQEYRYQDKQLTTTRTKNNAGWILYYTVLDNNWTYGEWSGYSRSSYSEYTNATSKREVQTQSVQDSAACTLYNWYYYRYWNSSAGTYYYTYSSSMGGTRYDWQTNYCLPQIGTYSGHAGYKPAGGKNFSGEIWFLASTQDVAATSHTEWRYRDATKGYTYYWYKWKDWTDWSTDKVAESQTRKVETRTTYRYRTKMQDIEDNSGDVYKTVGTVDKELAGKQAALLVYKNDEPSDSNNEYVGQSVIGEDGGYNFEYITRETISAKTGDYTVALAIEGATEPIFLETIEAPKPKYTVVFKDDDGNIIDTQEVVEGKSATSPKVPNKEHYYFVGWDYGFTNVKEDMEITAQYTKNKYSIAFVNWETKEVETQVFSYDEPVTYPEETTIEGYDFVNWTTMDGNNVETVTENLVLMANYKIQTYTINFYDKDEKLLSTQQVDYGNNAKEPTAPEIDKMVFKGWSSYRFIQAKESLDVYPVYEYIETTLDPSCDTPSGVFTESKKIHLTAENGAVIYYTTDGSNPTITSTKYNGEIVISKNTYLQYIAVAPDKNVSKIKNVSFLVSSGEDDKGALVVKKENFNLERGTETSITYFLSHEDENIGVNFYSLDESVASVDENGTIHANQVGKTQIFISTKDRKYADYCNVEVTSSEIDVESIVLNSTSIVGTTDEKVQMSAKVYPENATEQGVDWYTDDATVASVSESGEVQILNKGVTTLRAFSKTGTCFAECTIKGVLEYPQDKLEVSPQILVLEEGEEGKFITYYGESDVECTWISEDEEIAAIVDGKVTARKEGYTIVTATTVDGIQASCTVIVKKKNDSNIAAKPTATPTNTDNNGESPVNTQFPSTKPVTTQEPSDSTNKNTDKSNSTSNTVKKPKRIIGLTVKSVSKKKLKVTWKRMTGVSGFEVQYAKNKTFTKGKKIKKYGSLTNAITLKKLKSKNIYYVRVRAYNQSGSKKVYGSWSKVKKCKVK